MKVLALAFAAFVGFPLSGFLLMYNGAITPFFLMLITMVFAGLAGEDLKARRSKAWNSAHRMGGTYYESPRSRKVSDLLLGVHGPWKLATALFVLGGVAGLIVGSFLR